MPEPTLFRDRSRAMQVVIGGLVPIAVGALAGILLGVSAVAYWIVAALAAVGAFFSGLEHLDGWGGADRGFFGGLFYGIALLVAHALAGTHAKVSLGSLPPFLVVITTLVGMALAATAGRMARLRRESSAAALT